MNGPWFRTYGGFGYAPTNWKGVGVILAMLGVVLPCGWISVAYTDREPLLEWGAAVVGAAAAIAGHAVVVWKLERNYSGEPRSDAASHFAMKGCIFQVITLVVAFAVLTIFLNIGR